MMESTSSCTKSSGLKANFATAKRTTADRKSAPGWACCLASQASRRLATPGFCGMPASPAVCSIVRRLSVMANWPSRKKPSRAAVAIQFGLPRPALRKATLLASLDLRASAISSSLISNGLNPSRRRSFRTSMCSSSMRRVGYDGAIFVSAAITGQWRRRGAQGSTNQAQERAKQASRSRLILSMDAWCLLEGLTTMTLARWLIPGVAACLLPGIAMAQDLEARFRLAQDPKNIQGCTAYDSALTRVHTFTLKGGQAEVKSAGGIDDKMKLVRPN